MARTQKIINFVPDNVKKPSGIRLDGKPNVSWKKFEERLKSYDQVLVEDWGPEEVLGHIAKRYKDYALIDFGLSYSGPPSKCGEMFLVRRMMYKIGTEKGAILKEYVDWVYDKVIIPQKISITSLAFFFTEKVVSQFKAQFRKSKKITKSTELPNDYVNAAIGLELSINTYGDLAFIKMALSDDPEREDFDVYRTFFDEIKRKGFDEEILLNME